MTDNGQPPLADERVVPLVIDGGLLTIPDVREPQHLHLVGGAPGLTYTIEYKSHLNDPTWIPLSDLTPAARGDTRCFRDPIDSRAGTRFYRVRTKAN